MCDKRQVKLFLTLVAYHENKSIRRVTRRPMAALETVPRVVRVWS